MAAPRDPRIRGRRILFAAGLLGLVVLAAGMVALLRGGSPESLSEGELGPGPSRVEAGVPVGYAPSEAGAAAAAIHYDAALFGPLLLDAEALGHAVSAVAATPEGAAVLERTLRGRSPALDGDEEVRSYWRRAPLGYEVAGYGSERAEVLVWGVSAGTEAIETPYVGAATTLVRWRLVWVDDDWRIGDVELLGEEALADPARLRAFTEVRHGP